MHKFIEKTPPRAINLQTGGWTQFPDTGDDEATAPEVAPQPRPTATPQFQTLVEQVQRSEKAVPQLIEILNQEGLEEIDILSAIADAFIDGGVAEDKAEAAEMAEQYLDAKRTLGNG